MRYFTIFVLLLITAISVITATSVYLLKFKSDSYPSHTLKRIVLHYPQVVDTLGLNQPGDFRFAYLQSTSPQINVEIDYHPKAKPHPEISEWVEAIIHETTGKTSRITVAEDRALSRVTQYTNQQLNLLRTLTQNNPDQNAPYLHILYLPEYSQDPSYAGLVIHRDTIFIFKDAIQALSEDAEIKARVEKSTLMHEWGHLLGLEHLNQDNCVMSESVEVFGNRKFQNHNLPTKYCFETLQTLQQLKNTN